MAKQEKPPKAVNLEELPKARPIMCTRQELPKYFPGMSSQTWANLAHLKQGPRYYKIGKFCWYVIDEVVEYLTQYTVETSNQPIPMEQFREQTKEAGGGKWIIP